jgi:hypothetical protein
MSHPSEDDLILYHYGEKPRARVGEHLASCPACRDEYAALRRVLDATGTLEPPARGEQYGREVWFRIRGDLATAPAPAIDSGFFERLADWIRPRRWVPVGALAVLVIATTLAFVAGRLWPRSQTTTSGTSPAATGEQSTAAGRALRDRILLVAVGEHLDRSQMILVEIVNQDGGGPSSLSAAGAHAADLVTENRLYRQTAAQAGETALADVLQDLEGILLEVAHGGPDLVGPRLDALRQRIESEGLLFKVRVIESNVRARERISIEERARRRS